MPWQAGINLISSLLPPVSSRPGGELISQEEGVARLLPVRCSPRDWRAAMSVRPSARPPLLLPGRAHEHPAAPGGPQSRYTVLILTRGAQSWFHPTACVLGRGPFRSSRSVGSPAAAARPLLYYLFPHPHHVPRSGGSWSA